MNLKLVILSYLLGGFNTGYYLVKFMIGKDIRQLGSGSTGASNVKRIMGKKGFIIVLILDMLRGMAIIEIGRWFSADFNTLSLMLCALIVGNIFPLQLQFRGGKGIAAGIGGLIILMPVVALILALHYTVLRLIKVSHSLSMAINLFVFPLLVAWYFSLNAFICLSSLFSLAMILLAHRDRIKKFSKEPKYSFKIANTKDEFKQIHLLNYETFVEEIPQHSLNPSKMQIDKFHNENTYIICLLKKKVIGMVAIRSKRPFSLDQKIENLDSYLPLIKQWCEIRLLSIRKEYRHLGIFKKIMQQTLSYCHQNNFDGALISGTVRQLELYNYLGFIPFGHLVGETDALFQPMFITKNKVELLLDQPNEKKLWFTPGPVHIKQAIADAFLATPISHRNENFKKLLQKVTTKLCELTQAQCLQIFAGNGTFANDVIAAHLKNIDGKGLIISYGEFGERLSKHADNMNLEFDEIHSSWVENFNYELIEKKLASKNSYAWLWVVHCETSTGNMCDVEKLSFLCQQYDCKLVLDCISSLGIISLNLSGVYLASSTSGKGLGCYPGLALVFHQSINVPIKSKSPRVLDLQEYIAKGGIPYTISSNFILALYQAVFLLNPLRLNAINKYVTLFKKQLLDSFYHVLSFENSNPAIITIQFLKDGMANKMGVKLASNNIFVNFESDYLAKRNWMQICFYSEDYTEKDILHLAETMNKLLEIP